jgi:hypothetical protein
MDKVFGLNNSSIHHPHAIISRNSTKHGKQQGI